MSKKQRKALQQVAESQKQTNGRLLTGEVSFATLQALSKRYDDLRAAYDEPR